MKKVSEHLGQIIVALAGVALLVAAVVVFKAPIGDFFNGTIKKEATISNKVLDGVFLPSISKLQERHEFYYYSSLALAVDDINADAIGVNAVAEKEDAVAAVYVEGDYPYAVLLKDNTEIRSVIPTVNMTINLGGKTVRFENLEAGIDTVENSNATIFIDGRLDGSEIAVSNTDGTKAFGVYNRAGNEIAITNGTIVATAASAMARGINNDGTLSVSNCNISATSDSANATGVRPCSSTKVINCNITATSDSGYAYGIYFATGTGSLDVSRSDISSVSKSGTAAGIVSLSSTTTVTDSNIIPMANFTSSACSVGIQATGTLTLNNCYVTATTEGVSAKGALYVNGGTYEGFNHGGIYFSGAGTTSYVKDATLRHCDIPEGYTTTYGSMGAGFYVGGSSTRKNITIYMDNCNVDGYKYPFVLRGSSGEENNSVYISNSNINLDSAYGGIRIDDVTHRLFIGSGNNFGIDDAVMNFTADEAAMSEVAVLTNENYGNATVAQ